MSQLQTWLGRRASSSGRGVGGMAELVAPLAHLVVRRQDAVHRALRAEVLPLVEQRGVDLRGREVDEARLVQHGEDGGLLAGA